MPKSLYKQSFLKKMIILVLFFLSLTCICVGANLKGYDKNRLAHANSFLSTLKNKGMGINGSSISSQGLHNLNRVVDAYASSSQLAKELKHNGAYDGDVHASAYVKKNRLTQADINFLYDYGLVTTLAITPYDVSYRWAGNHGSVIDETATRGGMDCSGFTHFALRAGFGIQHAGTNAHGYHVTYGRPSSGGARRGIVIRMFNYGKKAQFEHVGFVSGNAQVHARGGDKPVKWKTIDITNVVRTAHMTELPVENILSVRGTRQVGPFSPVKIQNLVSMMRTGVKGGSAPSVVQNEENRDNSAFDLKSGQQFILRVNLEKMILQPYMDAIKRIYTHLTKYVLAIYVVLACLDFSLFAFKNILGNSDLMGYKALVMLGQRFVRYASYITLIQLWQPLVVKPVMHLFSGAVLNKFLQNLDTSTITTNGKMSSLSMIFQQIALEPIDLFISCIRTINENVLQVARAGSGEIMLPYGTTYLGSSVHNVSIANIIIVAILYLVGVICSLIALSGIIITVIYAIMLVVNVMLCLIDAFIISTFAIFNAMLGGLDILSGFGIVGILSNIFVPFTKLLVTYTFMIMTMQVIKESQQIFPIEQDFPVMLMLSARPVYYIIMFGLFLLLYKGVLKIIGESGI